MRDPKWMLPAIPEIDRKKEQEEEEANWKKLKIGLLGLGLMIAPSIVGQLEEPEEEEQKKYPDFPALRGNRLF